MPPRTAGIGNVSANNSAIYDSNNSNNNQVNVDGFHNDNNNNNTILRTASAHWYRHAGSRRSTCSVIGCSNPATVGAHVHELTSKRGGDWSHWIVPMCHRCNMSPDDLPVDIRVALISANTQAMGCYLPY